MYKLSRILLISFIIVNLFSCTREVIVVKAQEKQGLEKLHAEIDYYANDPNLKNAFLGIYIASLENPKVIYKLNEHRIFVPASNQKLYTTAAALHKLGPDFRYQTKFFAKGTLSKGILQGDLIIKGAGDPTLSGRFHESKDILAEIKAWADSLKEKGITKIEGGLIGDNSFFADDILGTGWSWDNESYYYAAQTSALSFNDNCIDFTAEAGSSAGSPADISMNPEIEYAEIINNSRTTANDSIYTLAFWRERAKNIIHLDGEIPLKAKPEKESITVEKPAEYLLAVFRSVLKEKGIETAGKNIVISRKDTALYQDADSLYTYYSVPLSDIVNVINKRSHNLYAEQLMKTLGGLYKGKGSFRNGASVMKNFLTSSGVSDDEIIIVDGSGLSRRNFISPYSMAVLLRKMAHSSNFDTFYDSLPIAGVDGTLKRRMKGMRAEGNVRAKTGYVSNVRNLSGYVKDKKDRQYIFSILVNNYTVPTSYVNDLQDNICNLIAEFGGELQ